MFFDVIIESNIYWHKKVSNGFVIICASVCECIRYARHFVQFYKDICKYQNSQQLNLHGEYSYLE